MQEEFLKWLEEVGPDVCVTAGYGLFLPPKLLSIPARGTLNIHPSLLPRYRGAAPVQRCLQVPLSSPPLSPHLHSCPSWALLHLKLTSVPLFEERSVSNCVCPCLEAGTLLLTTCSHRRSCTSYSNYNGVSP